MMDLARQYDLVRSSRSVLFDYCKTISAGDFLEENSSFGRGSIRNLLVHIANTYQFWIGNQAMKKELLFTSYDSVGSIEAADVVFAGVDSLVSEFIQAYSGRETDALPVIVGGKPETADAFKLFTHVITHEYHHKGQILSLSRHLGYIPVDTDVMR